MSLAVAAAFHGLLWTLGETGVGGRDGPGPSVMQVRALPAAPVAPDVTAAKPAPAAKPPAPGRQRAIATPSMPAQPPAPGAAPDQPSATVAVTEPVSAHEQVATREQADAAVDADLVRNVAAPGELAVPVYRTRLPPSAILSYDLHKGFFSGSGQLAWKPSGDRYEARLEGSVAGMTLLTQTSVGQLDAHGLAPTRYTDARTRRGVNAANFQRDKGKITYSGPQVEYPLLPGTQDRVSWMLQIGAILNADPRLARPDEKIVMFVSGANGDADVWVFRFEGTDTLRTDSGPVHAVKFTREPRKAYDRAIEIWLAPARHHLPVRARFTTSAGGDAFELLLRDMQLP